MKWFDIITKAVKTALGQGKILHILKASLVVGIVVIIRKFLKTGAPPTVLFESISDFYKKLSGNKLTMVSILPDSIHYVDNAKQLFKAFLPRSSHI